MVEQETETQEDAFTVDKILARIMEEDGGVTEEELREQLGEVMTRWNDMVDEKTAAMHLAKGAYDIDCKDLLPKQRIDAREMKVGDIYAGFPDNKQTWIAVTGYVITHTGVVEYERKGDNDKKEKAHRLECRVADGTGQVLIRSFDSTDPEAHERFNEMAGLKVGDLVMVESVVISAGSVRAEDGKGWVDDNSEVRLGGRPNPVKVRKGKVDIPPFKEVVRSVVIPPRETEDWKRNNYYEVTATMVGAPEAKKFTVCPTCRKKVKEGEMCQTHNRIAVEQMVVSGQMDLGGRGYLWARFGSDPITEYNDRARKSNTPLLPKDPDDLENLKIRFRGIVREVKSEDKKYPTVTALMILSFERVEQNIADFLEDIRKRRGLSSKKAKKSGKTTSTKPSKVKAIVKPPSVKEPEDEPETEQDFDGIDEEYKPVCNDIVGMIGKAEEESVTASDIEEKMSWDKETILAALGMLKSEGTVYEVADGRFKLALPNETGAQEDSSTDATDQPDAEGEDDKYDKEEMEELMKLLVDHIKERKEPGVKLEEITSFFADDEDMLTEALSRTVKVGKIYSPVENVYVHSRFRYSENKPAEKEPEKKTEGKKRSEKGVKDKKLSKKKEDEAGGGKKIDATPTLLELAEKVEGVVDKTGGMTMEMLSTMSMFFGSEVKGDIPKALDYLEEVGRLKKNKKGEYSAVKKQKTS